MAEYSRVTREEAEAILEKFGRSLSSLEPLPGGAANSSYKVNHDELVLTVCDNYRVSDPVVMLGLIDRLAEANFDVPTYLRVCEGDQLPKVNGVPVLLKEFVSGTTTTTWSEDNLRRLGGVLAALSEVSVPEGFSVGQGKRLPAGWMKMVGEAPNRLRQEIRLANHNFRYREGKESLPRGLIHGDIFPDNLLLTEGGITILDWETACEEVLVLEVAVALIGMCRAGSEFRAGSVEALLAGYIAVRPLVPAERRVLLDAVRYANAVLMYHRFVRHNVLYPDSRHAEDYAELLSLSDKMVSGDFAALIGEGLPRL